MDAPRGSRSWGDHPVVVIVGILAGLAAIAALVIQLLGSDGGADTTDPTTDDGSSVTQTGGTSTGDPGTSDPVTTDPTEDPSTSTPPPSGVDLELALQTDTCSIVPGGGLEGGDVMTLLFRVVSSGGVAYEGGVLATARSDSGLQGESTGSMSTDPASSFVQVEFAGQDYGRTHEFTVEVSPTDDVVDVDPSNDVATITVELPEVRDPDGGAFDPCA